MREGAEKKVGGGVSVCVGVGAGAMGGKGRGWGQKNGRGCLTVSYDIF